MSYGGAGRAVAVSGSSSAGVSSTDTDLPNGEAPAVRDAPERRQPGEPVRARLAAEG